jgi:predicted dehydrogenase
MQTALKAEVSEIASTASDVRVAVIGCGYWGPNLIRNFFDTPGCTVSAVCDVSAERLAHMKHRHPSVRVTSEVDEVLRDPNIDAVAIATPVRTHYALADAALRSGKHVLVEKPMTTTTQEAEVLVALAEREGLTLMVDHTFIYTGAVRKIKSLLDAGELGRMFYYDSVRVNLGLIQHDVSVIWDLAAHDLAIMDYLLEQSPVSIGATAAAHFPGGLADVAYITVQFPDSLIAHFHVNWLSPVKVRQVLLGGDRRMVLYDDIEATEKVKVYDRGVQWNGDPEEARTKALVGYRLGDVFTPQLDQTEALRHECAHFIECVRENKSPLTDGESGLRNVRMLEAAEFSLRHDGAIQRLR